MDRLRRRRNPGEDGAGRRAIHKVNELARSEFTLALPAAKRAASHAAQAFFKKFSEEYTKERKKKHRR
jgi:predicted acetyltransferase